MHDFDLIFSSGVRVVRILLLNNHGQVTGVLAPLHQIILIEDYGGLLAAVISRYKYVRNLATCSSLLLYCKKMKQ